MFRSSGPFHREGAKDTKRVFSLFGGAAGLFDGANDYLTTPDSDDWTFGSDDFTVDMWIRFNSLPTASNYVVFYDHVSGNTYNQLYMANTAGGYKIRWYSSNAGSLVIDTGAVAWTPSAGVWYHLAAVRHGTQFDLYVDGVSIKSLTGISGAVGNPAASLAVGA